MFSRFDRVPACDGRTDGPTDVKPIAITCFSIADARKKATKPHYTESRLQITEFNNKMRNYKSNAILHNCSQKTNISSEAPSL